MIKRNEITSVGTLVKPHGIKGEITAQIDVDIDLKSVRCIILDIDGIFVPFFITETRPKSQTSVLLHIEDIDSDEEAKQICGHEIFLLNSDLPEMSDEDSDNLYISDMVGFTVYNNGSPVGKIVDYDDSTDNTLFIVKPIETGKDDKIYIPVVEEYVIDINTDNKSINMSLPDGLVDLNNQ